MTTPAQMTTGQIFILFFVGCLLGLGVAYLFIFDRSETTAASTPKVAQLIMEPPREILPMEEMQSAFTRKTFESVDEKGITHKFTYHLMEPYKAIPNKKYPLVVVLHGRPGRGYAAQYLARSDERQKYPAYVLVPVMPLDTLWAFPKKVEAKFKGYDVSTKKRRTLLYVIEMIKEQVASRPVDPHRIYVIGCSEGGFGAFGAAIDYPDVFAAAVSISGGWDIGDADKLGRIPLKVIHGGLDENVIPEFSSRISAKAMEQTSLVSYTEIADMAHECPNETLYQDNLWRWLFAQKKS